MSGLISRTLPIIKLCPPLRQCSISTHRSFASTPSSAPTPKLTKKEKKEIKEKEKAAEKEAYEQAQKAKSSSVTAPLKSTIDFEKVVLPHQFKDEYMKVIDSARSFEQLEPLIKDHLDQLSPGEIERIWKRLTEFKGNLAADQYISALEPNLQFARFFEQTSRKLVTPIWFEAKSVYNIIMSMKVLHFRSGTSFWERIVPDALNMFLRHFSATQLVNFANYLGSRGFKNPKYLFFYKAMIRNIIQDMETLEEKTLGYLGNSFSYIGPFSDHALRAAFVKVIEPRIATAPNVTFINFLEAICFFRKEHFHRTPGKTNQRVNKFTVTPELQQKFHDQIKARLPTFSVYQLMNVARNWIKVDIPGDFVLPKLYDECLKRKAEWDALPAIRSLDFLSEIVASNPEFQPNQSLTAMLEIVKEKLSAVRNMAPSWTLSRIYSNLSHALGRIEHFDPVVMEHVNHYLEKDGVITQILPRLLPNFLHGYAALSEKRSEKAIKALALLAQARGQELFNWEIAMSASRLARLGYRHDGALRSMFNGLKSQWGTFKVHGAAQLIWTLGSLDYQDRILMPLCKHAQKLLPVISTDALSALIYGLGKLKHRNRDIFKEFLKLISTRNTFTQNQWAQIALGYAHLATYDDTVVKHLRKQLTGAKELMNGWALSKIIWYFAHVRVPVDSSLFSTLDFTAFIPPAHTKIQKIPAVLNHDVEVQLDQVSSPDSYWHSRRVQTQNFQSFHQRDLVQLIWSIVSFDKQTELKNLLTKFIHALDSNMLLISLRLGVEENKKIPEVDFKIDPVYQFSLTAQNVGRKGKKPTRPFWRTTKRSVTDPGHLTLRKDYDLPTRLQLHQVIKALQNIPEFERAFKEAGITDEIKKMLHDEFVLRGSNELSTQKSLMESLTQRPTYAGVLRERLTSVLSLMAEELEFKVQMPFSDPKTGIATLAYVPDDNAVVMLLEESQFLYKSGTELGHATLNIRLLKEAGYNVIQIRYPEWFEKLTPKDRDLYIDEQLKPIYEKRWAPPPEPEKRLARWAVRLESP